MDTRKPVRLDPDKDLNPKQLEAIRLLEDPASSVRYVLFSGGVGSGKTRLAVYWCLLNAWRHKGTKWLIVRKHLGKLLLSTVATLIQFANELGIPYEHNQTTKTFTLANGSQILYLQIDPALDPELHSIGGLEISGFVLDEAVELDRIVFSTLLQRCRHGLTENNIYGRAILICNPSRSSWLYSEVYCPWERNDGTLNKSWGYVHSVPSDNPYAVRMPGYLESLSRENMSSDREYAQKVNGDWHASDEDTLLFHESDIINCANWSTEGVDRRDKYITVDVGGSGAKADRSIIMVWEGMVLVDVIERKGLTTVELAAFIRGLIAQHKVPIKNVAVDAIGIGQGVVDQLRGCVAFRANGKVFNGEAYAHLKDQLFHRLAEAVGKGEVRFKAGQVKDGKLPSVILELAEELVAHKCFNSMSDSAQRVTPKEQVARVLGRSPDLADCAMMRMLWTYKSNEMKVQLIDWDWRTKRRA